MWAKGTTWRYNEPAGANPPAAPVVALYQQPVRVQLNTKGGRFVAVNQHHPDEAPYGNGNDGFVYGIGCAGK